MISSLLKSRRVWVATAIGCLAMAFLWYYTSCYVGMAAAHLDCTFGRYEVKLYGYRCGNETETDRKHFQRLSSLLKERYNVNVTDIKWCVIEPGMQQYVNGYNAVSSSRILFKYGFDVFQECSDLAIDPLEHVRP